MVGVVCGFCGLSLTVCFYVCWLILLSVVICCLFDCCSYLVGVAGFGLVVGRVSSWFWLVVLRFVVMLFVSSVVPCVGVVLLIADVVLFVCIDLWLLIWLICAGWFSVCDLWVFTVV